MPLTLFNDEEYRGLPEYIKDVPVIEWIMGRKGTDLIYVSTSDNRGIAYRFADGRYEIADEFEAFKFVETGVKDLIKTLESLYTASYENDNDKNEFKNGGELRLSQRTMRLKKFHDNALYYLNSGKIDSLVSLFIKKKCLSKSKFDTDHTLLNMKNGVFDLKTLTFRNRTPEDRFLKCMPAAFVQGAQCPKWQAELEHATGGNHTLLQEIRFELCYSLLRRPLKRIYRWKGPSDTVKTTLLETVALVIGKGEHGYLYKAPQDFFTVEKGEQATRDDIIQSKNSAILWIDEPKITMKGEDKAFVKDFTGGGNINQRGIYDRNINFLNTCTPFLTANKLPSSDPTDDGMKTRDVVVPFVIKIPSEMKIERFWEVLAREEGDGILQWLIQGVEEIVRSDGAIPPLPAEVIQATEQYTNQSELVRKVIDEFYVLLKDEYGRLARVSLREINEKISEYISDNRIGIKRLPSSDTVIRTLTSMGCEYCKDVTYVNPDYRSRHVFKNIRKKTEAESGIEACPPEWESKPSLIELELSVDEGDSDIQKVLDAIKTLSPKYPTGIPLNYIKDYSLIQNRIDSHKTENIVNLLSERGAVSEIQEGFYEIVRR